MRSESPIFTRIAVSSKPEITHKRDIEIPRNHRFPSVKRYSPLKEEKNKEYRFKLNKIRLLAKNGPLPLKQKMMPVSNHGFFDEIKTSKMLQRKQGIWKIMDETISQGLKGIFVLSKQGSFIDLNEAQCSFITNAEANVQTQTLKDERLNESFLSEKEASSPGRITVLIKHNKDRKDNSSSAYRKTRKSMHIS